MSQNGLVCLLLFRQKLCKHYGLVLFFLFIGRYLGFKCIIILMSSIVRSVLNDFSKNLPISSFSDWSVIVILLSVFHINQINSCNQSIPSSGFLFSRQVKKRCPKFFLNPLLSASTVILPANFTSILLTSQYFHVVGGIFLFFLSSGGIIATSDPVSTMNCFCVPSFFTVMVIWFLLSVRVPIWLLYFSTCRYRFLRSCLVP